MDYSQFHARYRLKIEIEDKIALLTLDRPEKKNAIDLGLHEGLEHAFRALSYDNAVGAIVLTGAGDTFCAGGDLKGFYPEDHIFRNSMRSRALNWAQLHCETPLIAAVNGTAAGLGATLALMCDVIFMADTARIGDTHVKVGLTAGDGGQVIWPLLVGPHRAKEYLMSGELIPAAEADRIGLVNHVVPADQLMARARDYAAKLANGAQSAIRWAKLAVNKMVEQQQVLSLDFGLATEFMCSSGTEDTREAMSAFAEKRAPKFKGT
jgi:enoyl-CoA hydratase/carnithine racemase